MANESGRSNRTGAEAQLKQSVVPEYTQRQIETDGGVSLVRSAGLLFKEIQKESDKPTPTQDKLRFINNEGLYGIYLPNEEVPTIEFDTRYPRDAFDHNQRPLPFGSVTLRINDDGIHNQITLYPDLEKHRIVTTSDGRNGKLSKPEFGTPEAMSTILSSIYQITNEPHLLQQMHDGLGVSLSPTRFNVEEYLKWVVHSDSKSLSVHSFIERLAKIQKGELVNRRNFLLGALGVVGGTAAVSLAGVAGGIAGYSQGVKESEVQQVFTGSLIEDIQKSERQRLSDLGLSKVIPMYESFNRIRRSMGELGSLDRVDWLHEMGNWFRIMQNVSWGMITDENDPDVKRILGGWKNEGGLKPTITHEEVESYIDNVEIDNSSTGEDLETVREYLKSLCKVFPIASAFIGNRFKLLTQEETLAVRHSGSYDTYNGLADVVGFENGAQYPLSVLIHELLGHGLDLRLDILKRHSNLEAFLKFNEIRLGEVGSLIDSWLNSSEEEVYQSSLPYLLYFSWQEFGELDDQDKISNEYERLKGLLGVEVKDPTDRYDPTIKLNLLIRKAIIKAKDIANKMENGSSILLEEKEYYRQYMLEQLADKVISHLIHRTADPSDRLSGSHGGVPNDATTMSRRRIDAARVDFFSTYPPGTWDFETVVNDINLGQVDSESFLIAHENLLNLVQEIEGVEILADLRHEENGINKARASIVQFQHLNKRFLCSIINGESRLVDLTTPSGVGEGGDWDLQYIDVAGESNEITIINTELEFELRRINDYAYSTISYEGSINGENFPISSFERLGTEDYVAPEYRTILLKPGADQERLVRTFGRLYEIPRDKADFIHDGRVKSTLWKYNSSSDPYAGILFLRDINDNLVPAPTADYTENELLGMQVISVDNSSITVEKEGNKFILHLYLSQGAEDLNEYNNGDSAGNIIIRYFEIGRVYGQKIPQQAIFLELNNSSGNSIIMPVASVTHG